MDGDVWAGMQAAMEDYRGVDVLVGIGGATEAVLAAAAIKCIGGEIQCKIWPRDDKEREQLKADGVDLELVLHTDDLVRGNDVSFAATGITSGELVDGVQYFGWGARTSSVMMRSRSGTIRYIHAQLCATYDAHGYSVSCRNENASLPRKYVRPNRNTEHRRATRRL